MLALSRSCLRTGLRILVIVLSVSLAPRLAQTQSLEALLNSPAWRVDYDVTIVASSTRPYGDARGGTGTIATSLESSFSASFLIDLRSEGPNMVLDLASSASTAGAAPSIEDALAATEAMLARMEGTANWMSTGGLMSLPDDPDAPVEDILAAGLDAMRANAAPARLAYEQLTSGQTRNEFDEPYSFSTRVTSTAAGDVVVGSGGPSDAMFQLETRANQYRLAIPLVFRGDLTEANIAEVRVERIELAGEPAAESETRREISFDSSYLPITVDDVGAQPAGGSGGLVIVGDIHLAAGKLSGERAVPIHMTDTGYDRAQVPGTLTVRFTLTPVGL